MLLENKFYRLAKWPDGWRCEEVGQEEADRDFRWCAENRHDCRFTIRSFGSGIAFLLYSPHATHGQINAQAARMVATPGR